MSTGTIVLIIVIAVVVLALIGLAAMMANKKKQHQRHTQAESMRHEAAAGAPAVHDSELRAREADARAEQARVEAERAERAAAQARQGVTQEEARVEDRVREADRLDPHVDHRSDDYTPETPAATGTGTTGATHEGTTPLDEHGRPVEGGTGTHRST